MLSRAGSLVLLVLQEEKDDRDRGDRGCLFFFFATAS